MLASIARCGNCNDPATPLLLIYTIVIMSGIIVLLDWLGRRKDRQSKQPKLPF